MEVFTEDDPQKAVHKLMQISKDCNVTISTQKWKVMAFKGAYLVRSKNVIDNVTLEQANYLKYIGNMISYTIEL